MNAVDDRSAAASMATPRPAPGTSEPDPTLLPLLPTHAAVAAALQSGAMAAGTGDSAWTPEAIAELLALPGSFGFLAVARSDEPRGLVFCRSVAGEGEVLVLAVLPEQWRRGLGRMLLAAALARAREMGLRRMLLEVAVDNGAARALYEAAGFEPVGRRRDYYRRAGGHSVDALTLACSLPD